MRSFSPPANQHLVLVGGGHSHLEVLRRFGMEPLPGLRITLVARDVHTPYSGMFPGFVAGHYGYDDVHVDLDRLCVFAGARLLRVAATGLDLNSRRVELDGRPSMAFDLLSLNTGSVPRLGGPPDRRSLPIKPWSGFLAAWPRICAAVVETGRPFELAVVGAGAGGVELALAAQYRLLHLLREANRPPDLLRVTLIAASVDVMPKNNPRTRRLFRQVLAERGIKVRLRTVAVELNRGRLSLGDGGDFPCDAAFWVTGAEPAGWLRQSGLAVDEGGFVAVDERLQSISHPGVFAAGDVAAVVAHPRPKSGVFAVRQGPPLAFNLRRCAQQQPLRPFRPQRRFLSLVTTGDRDAVASRGGWAARGSLFWWWKDRIDRRFMRRYAELPFPEPEPPAGRTPTADPMGAAMRCGAKVGSGALRSTLRRLRLHGADDASIVGLDDGTVQLETVGLLRQLVDDPFVSGEISAEHALSDIYAMGGEPLRALALAVVETAAPALLEEDLFQLLSGATRALGRAKVELAGGHTGEGGDPALGFAVTGKTRTDRLWRKGGLRAGDALILTKPLGTGVLFAARMRGLVKGHWIEAALAVMTVSNRAAVPILRDYGASACTDVTGFGLYGHALEMARASGLVVVLDLDHVPSLGGALELTRAGVRSSSYGQNRAAMRERGGSDLDHPILPLLFDPQTSGGLLVAVPADKASLAVTTLRHAGYRAAAIVGDVRPLPTEARVGGDLGHGRVLVVPSLPGGAFAGVRKWGNAPTMAGGG